jgi:ATP-dependent Clp protease protease subunit
MKPNPLSLLAGARAAGVFVMASIAPKAGLPNLLQLVRDNADRTGTLRAEASGDEAHVYVYGVIGGYWGDVSATAFAATLVGIKATTVHLHINSPGGDVFEARAMMSAIANHSATFIAHVDGLAASAASDLIMACDEIEISQGGFVMIHNAWTLAMGNKDDMRTTADLLEKVDEAIVDDYRKKTKKSAEQIREWMDQETWFTAEEARENGFVDRIVEVVPAEESEEAVAEDRWNLSAYEKAPAALKQVSRAKPKPATDPAAYRAGLERRLRLLERTAA